jgi:predicted methyltransferase
MRCNVRGHGTVNVSGVWFMLRVWLDWRNSILGEAMRKFAVALMIAAVTMTEVAFAGGVPSYIADAVNDAARPEKDRARDADREPAAILTLAGVRPGHRVVDVGPGSGYYARILSRIVGPKGKVYGFNPTWIAEKYPVAPQAMTALNASGYANIEGVVQPMAEIKFDGPVNLIFMSQVYHDQVWQKIDIAKMNKAIFDALKPGGVFFVIDHIGRGVTTVEQMDKLHRIDPALVKEQILAAGFVLLEESDLLRNPYDLGDKSVFSPDIRGRTDQFVFKFVKPK